jgi:hypothetical protein
VRILSTPCAEGSRHRDWNGGGTRGACGAGFGEDTMRRTMHALVAATVLAASACFYRFGPHPGVIYVSIEPPMPRVEVVVAQPGAVVWRPGHWRWTGRDYRWVPGEWIPLEPGYREWIPGRWARDRHGWYWIEGRWRR